LEARSSKIISENERVRTRQEIGIAYDIAKEKNLKGT